MSMIWNGRGWSAKNIDKKPVEIQWNQQIVTADYLVVPKGSPNKDAAMKFIAYASAPPTTRDRRSTSRTGRPTQKSTANPAMVNGPVGHQRGRESAYFDDEYLVEQLRRDRRRLAGLEGRLSR